MAGLHGCTKLNYSVFLSVLWNPSDILHCATPPTPTLQLQRLTEISRHLYRKKNNSASWYNPSEQKRSFFFLLFIREGNFLIWFLEETLAVFSVKGVLLGDYTGAVVQGHEATSVGVHAASLIIPHALL